MVNPCTITAQMSNGKFRSIYCYYDGDIEHTGKILAEHYTSQDKIESLIALGNLSELGETTDSHPDHNFSNQLNGYCVAYGRECGEPNSEATKECDTPEEALSAISYKRQEVGLFSQIMSSLSFNYLIAQNPNYLWDGNEWTVDGDNLVETLEELEESRADKSFFG
jgi:hypothetical protein